MFFISLESWYHKLHFLCYEFLILCKLEQDTGLYTERAQEAKDRDEDEVPEKIRSQIRAIKILLDLLELGYKFYIIGIVSL